MKSRYLLSAILSFGLFASAAFSQTTTSVTGTITDATGAVVPNATIKVVGLATRR